MPYAAKAEIEHEFNSDHLNVWLTFAYPMDQNVKPSHDLWTLTVDDIEKAISSSAWQDEFTLLLVSDAVVIYPDRVLLAYDGPSGNLQTTWGKDWEPWGDILSTDIGKGKCFIDRGDPSGYDFILSDFILDGAWHDLDLSGIIPVGVKAVLVRTEIRANTAGKTMTFRKKGNINNYNTNILRTQVGGVVNNIDMVVIPNTDRVIQYAAVVATWTRLLVVIKGWWY